MIAHCRPEITVPLTFVTTLSDKICSKDEIKHFYDEMRNNKITKTSQINPYQYEEFLKDYAEKGINDED